MVTEEMISKAIEKVKGDTYTDKHIKITVVGEDPTLSIFDSKFGGIPYLPQDAKVPVDSEGVQLGLLAQINCRIFTDNCNFNMFISNCISLYLFYSFTNHFFSNHLVPP